MNRDKLREQLKTITKAAFVAIDLAGLEEHDKCSRCGSTELLSNTTLVGDYLARLCMKCRNEWSEAVLGEGPIAVAFYAVNLAEGRAQKAGNDDEIKEAITESLHARLTMFRCAKAWVETR